tara:strand:+ start:3113 stop:3328 length:216 start_codon:yes stop_codon:yes gene_type:complete
MVLYKYTKGGTMTQLKTIDQTCNTIIDNAILLNTQYTKAEVEQRLVEWTGLARHLATQVADEVMTELAKIG